MPRAIGFGVIFLVGAVTGFFLAGPIVFADGAMGERVLTLMVAAGVYLLLGICSGWWLRTWTAGLWLAAPSIAVGLVMGEEWPIIGITIAGLLISAAGGAWLGARLRGKERSGGR